MNDDELTTAFELGEMEGVDFPHERHVRVAWGLAQRYDLAEAFERLSAGVRGIAERAGSPGAFHETITRAWFELIAAAEKLDAHPELFDKSLLGRYYSPAALASGREHWVEPDLNPLRLPPPALSSPPDLVPFLRGIPTPVAVLAVHDRETVHATTVSSFTLVSRDPPLLTVSLADGSRTLELVRAARAFALSVLASDQADVAERFADPDRQADHAQFAELPHRLDHYGPTIDDAAAWIGCDLHAVHRCGDHDIVVGHVGSAGRSDRRPLVRHDGTYH